MKKNHIVIALCLILGCDQKENFLDINGYINDFYLSKPYYHDRKKEIESIEMLEINYIENEAGFSNTLLGGQWIKSENGDHNINSFVEDSSYAAVYLYKKINVDKPRKACFSELRPETPEICSLRLKTRLTPTRMFRFEKK